MFLEFLQYSPGYLDRYSALLARIPREVPLRKSVVLYLCQEDAVAENRAIRASEDNRGSHDVLD